MIDPTQETVLCLADAASLLPHRRGGKRPHVSCLFRWTTAGCKGVILESIQVGGTRCTSKEALGRFFKALTNANLPTAQRPPTSRQRAAAAAERELQQEGL